MIKRFNQVLQGCVNFSRSRQFLFNMNQLKLALLFLLFTFLTPLSNAQEWVDKFQNVNQSTFKEIQASFNSHWKDRPYEKGQGFKQFKRWENYWENRLMPDGSFPDEQLKYTEYNGFVRKYGKSSRSVTANWTSMGPSTSSGGYAGIGRINSLGFHPTDVNKIYAGAAGGGFWLSNDGGVSWTTTTDDIGSLGVSGIVVDEVDPDIIYIATGDGDAQDNYSIGVLKSLDGGNTFSATGLSYNTSQGYVIRRLIADPNDNDILFVAGEDGIHRSTNAGATWTKVQSGNFYDLEPKYGASSNTFYATTSDDVYRSTDNGVTWSNIYTVSSSNRLALSTTPDDTDYVYILSSKSNNNGYNGVYRSTNSGNSFSTMSTTPNILHWSSTGSGSGGQGWYDLAFTADPNDAEIVYVGGVNTWKSTNGGSTWTLKTHWSGAPGAQTVHADKHVLQFRETVLWEGNDGGVYKSTNGGDSWTHLSNSMVISQMYRLGVSQQGTKVICGLQDNGTKLMGNSGTWSDEIGGDGMECIIDPSDNNVMYGALYYGDIRRSTNGGASWTNIQNNMPNNPSGAWVTPYTLVEDTPDTIIVGMKHVFRSFDRGNTWSIIGNNLAGGSNLNFIKVAPSNPDYIYAGRDGDIYRTTNGGSSWTSMTSPGSNIKMLEIHPNDPDSLWAVRSNFSSGNKVFVSSDGGASWTNITNNLPNIPANCIVYQKGTANGIYIGMDIGVYYIDDNLLQWELYNDFLPNVEITELDINYDEEKIYASTYGRGLWKSDLITNPVTCFFPANLALDSISGNNGHFSWNTPIIPPSLGYEYHLSTSASPPLSGNSTLDTTVLIGGLIYSQQYYFHLKSICSPTDSSAWITIGPFSIPPSCGDVFYDTGGSNSNYSNNENYITTICPETAGSDVTLTFNTFGVETGWDALYVFDGPNVNSPLISSGNPASNFGFPPGGYWGNIIPGPFTSSHTSGCITLQFMSDTYVTDDGWDLDVTCSPGCATSVSTTLDNVYGSLRNVIDCSTGGNIAFNIGLIGDTLSLTGSSILIDKDIIMSLQNNDEITIESTIDGPIFEIAPSYILTIENFNLLPKDDTEVILNNGSIKMGNLSIIGQDVSIKNNGALIIIPGSLAEFK